MPEIYPKSFGAFEKRTPDPTCTERMRSNKKRQLEEKDTVHNCGRINGVDLYKKMNECIITGRSLRWSSTVLL